MSDDTCAICLNIPEELSLIDGCFHLFCTRCITQWCQINPVCPLCKESIDRIIFDVKSQRDFRTLNIIQLLKEGKSVDGFISKLPDGLSFRRFVYAHGYRARADAQHFSVCPKNIADHFRLLPNQRLAASVFCDWVMRELCAATGEIDTNHSNIGIILRCVSSLLERFDVTDAQFSMTMRGFLFQNTELFVHELTHFIMWPGLGSATSVDAYDRYVVYPDLVANQMNGNAAARTIFQLARQESSFCLTPESPRLSALSRAPLSPPFRPNSPPPLPTREHYEPPPLPDDPS